MRGDRLMDTALWATIDSNLRFFRSYEDLKDHLLKAREEGIRAHVSEVAYMKEAVQ